MSASTADLWTKTATQLDAEQSDEDDAPPIIDDPGLSDPDDV
ncbi:hypothetical protein AB0J82_02275 [Asanoa sp. NPDC049518]